MWSYRTERGARAFFERWKQSLRWQWLAPYQKFVRMIERHWEGIAAYCTPENKVSLGLVEGLNNKIRVIQRSAYGYRDEDYLIDAPCPVTTNVCVGEILRRASGMEAGFR